MELLTAPATVQYEVTSRCNERCDFCYNVWKAGNKNLPTELSTSNSLKIIDECKKENVIRLIFTGGEPLLRKDLPLLISRAGEHKLYINLLTNGTLIEKEKKEILPVLEKYKVWTQMTFLGMSSHDDITHLKNSKNMTLKAFDILLSHKLPVSVNIVVLNQPLEEIEEAIVYFKNIGVKSIGLSRAIPRIPFGGSSLDRKRAKNLYKLMVKYNCGTFSPFPICSVEKFEKYRSPGSGCTAGFYFIVIGSNGKVRGCTHSPKEFADVVKVGLKKAWKSLEPYRKSAREPPDQCKKCGKITMCRAFCRELINCYGYDRWMGKPFPKEKGEFKFSDKEKNFLLNSYFKPYEILRKRNEPFGSIVFAYRKSLPLNKTATFIFDEICNGKTPKQIIDILCESYPNASKELIKENVLELTAFFIYSILLN